MSACEHPNRVPAQRLPHGCYSCPDCGRLFRVHATAVDVALVFYSCAGLLRELPAFERSEVLAALGRVWPPLVASKEEVSMADYDSIDFEKVTCATCKQRVAHARCKRVRGGPDGEEWMCDGCEEAEETKGGG